MNLKSLTEEELVAKMDEIHEELVSRATQGKVDGSIDFIAAKSRATIMCYPVWARNIITKNIFSPNN